jgi:hypothetical protein
VKTFASECEKIRTHTIRLVVYNLLVNSRTQTLASSLVIQKLLNCNSSAHTLNTMFTSSFSDLVLVCYVGASLEVSALELVVLHKNLLGQNIFTQKITYNRNKEMAYLPTNDGTIDSPRNRDTNNQHCHRLTTIPTHTTKQLQIFQHHHNIIKITINSPHI